MRARIAVLIVTSLLLYVPLSMSTQSARITSAKLMVWLDTLNPPLILDVRGKEIYNAGTLPGAINVGQDPMGYLPDDSKDPVVLVIPERAGNGFIEAWRRRLANAGHKVWVLESGLSGWKEAGGSVETSEVTYAKPGRVPFIIPRGLCEGNDPAQIFE